MVNGSESGSRGFSRKVIAALATAVCGIAAYRLATSIPWGDYSPLFWDCGALIQGIMNEGFPSGHGVIAGDYAILKYGYALPYWSLYRLASLDATFVLNLSWFAVMLIAPACSSLFRSNGEFAWAGYICYLAGMMSLPFVHKYIGMANPTIQSTALWLLLALYYDPTSGNPNSAASRFRVVPGLLCALLVLTDYKWLLPAVLGVMVIEFSEGPPVPGHDATAGRLKQWRGVLARVSLVVLWVCVALGIVSVFNHAYLAAILQYAIGPGSIDAFRATPSWNLLVFLWILGGLWAALWTMWRLIATRRKLLFGADAQTRIARRTIIFVTVLVTSFSLVLWPRGARMFAPAVVLGLTLLGWQAQVAVEALRTGTRRAWIPATLLFVVLITLVVRAFEAGENFRLTNGVAAMTEFVNAHREDIGAEPIGCFMPPIFNVGLEKPLVCMFLPARLQPTTDWVIGSDFIDRMIVEEQYLFGTKEPIWRSASLSARTSIEERGIFYASYLNDFYYSPHFICESNYMNTELVSLLARARRVEHPTWDLIYMGGLLGRMPPGSMKPLPRPRP